MKDPRDRTGAMHDERMSRKVPGRSVGPYGADIAPPQVKPEPAVQA